MPRLRFPEFGGEWETDQLGNMLKIGNGRDYKHLNSGSIPVYGSGGYMTSVDDYLYDGESVCIGRKGTIDNPLFLTGKFWTVDTLFFTHSFKKCYPKFVYLIFQNLNWQKYCEASGVPSLSKATIEKIEVQTTSLPEQQKIADCLTSLDDLIAAEERKLTALKTHKKGLMQRLFPSEGRTVPEWRFPEFRDCGEWEAKILGDTCDVRDGTHDSPIFYAVGMPLVTSKNLLSDGTLDINDVKYISRQDYDNINKRSEVKRGDILFGMIGTIGNPVLVKFTGFAIKNVALIKQKFELLNEFLVHLLQSPCIANRINTLSTGNSQKFVALGKIREMVILIPSLPEQQKIAVCLSALDELISAQVKKIETLKTHKKGLMQGLFPSAQEVIE